MSHDVEVPRDPSSRSAPADRPEDDPAGRSRRRRRSTRLIVQGVAVLTAVGVAGTGAALAAGAFRTAGPRPDGTAVTPLGTTVTPAGSQSDLGGLPLGMRLSPDGRTLLVSNDGQGEQSLQVVDPRTSRVVQTLPYPSPAALFVGLAFSPDGRTAYAAGGGSELVHRYAVAGGRLTERQPLQIPVPPSQGTTKGRAFPAGLDVTADGRRLLVANHLADSVSVVDLASGQSTQVAVGHAPLTVVSAEGGRTAYVTNQGADTVSVLDLSGATPTLTATVTVGTHPNAATLDERGARLYVSNGDEDSVSILDTARSRVVATIDLAPYPNAPVGTTPTGLALSADGRRLFVTNAGNNDVAVVDTRSRRTLGLIPTAWYPSAVVATADRLLVANAKGLGAGPNDGPGYPDPTARTPRSPAQYVGSMMTGTLSTLQLPLSREQLAAATRTVESNNGFDTEADAGDQENARANGGRPMPTIKHVIYVVKENRTYDQVLGSLGKGNGDPSLNLFGDESAPNTRALAEQYVTFDNFYADAEISAQGWNWTTQANSNPFAEALWPANYSGRNAPYPSENGDPAIAGNRDPKKAFIWDRLAGAGVSFRNYGFYVSPRADGSFHADDPVLEASTDSAFMGYDLSCPDSAGTFTPLKATCLQPRVDEWLKEFRGYEQSGSLPAVQMVRLPNDHTNNTRVGTPTPQGYVADNDLALGRLVEAVSSSKYWQDTAIFVTEDDAQNGPDHVDAHRTLALVISPYTRTGKVDSTFYSTVSMLRTIEDAVGVAPLTQFDAYATPMVAAFGRRADLRPYQALQPAKAGDERNAATAPMAAVSGTQRSGTADTFDEQLSNEAIWKSVKGGGSPMPHPRHQLLKDTTGTAGDE